MSLLRVSKLSKRFGQVWAVRELSFEVSGGEIVALLGPNGAGKTTTLRCIAGVLIPDEGSITIN
ncbi:ABC transporter, partial [Candidatus Fervidibacteria bacterium JGI MDM2 JNZ-1-D12]